MQVEVAAERLEAWPDHLRRSILVGDDEHLAAAIGDLLRVDQGERALAEAADADHHRQRPERDDPFDRPLDPLGPDAAKRTALERSLPLSPRRRPHLRPLGGGAALLEEMPCFRAKLLLLCRVLPRPSHRPGELLADEPLLEWRPTLVPVQIEQPLEDLVARLACPQLLEGQVEHRLRPLPGRDRAARRERSCRLFARLLAEPLDQLVQLKGQLGDAVNATLVAVRPAIRVQRRRPDEVAVRGDGDAAWVELHLQRRLVRGRPVITV